MTSPLSADAWDPDRYHRFRDERSQPFYDLLDLVRRPPDGPAIGLAVDLGCGTGELTRQLHERLGAKRTVGIDNSPNMLARAAAVSSEGLTFERGDIAEFSAIGRVDLIFSNAAIQWVSDHPQVLRRLTQLLVPQTGQIAIQMPANDDHVSHETARTVARQPRFAEALAGWTRPTAVLAPEKYAQLLFDLGYSQQHVRLQVYPHVLPDREAMIEWVRGTMLTDYQRRLPAELWPEFLDAYRTELFRTVPDARPTFHPFKRILMWAQR